MKRIVLSAVAAIVMTATLHASVSQVHITTLGASGDKWMVKLYSDVDHTHFIGLREKPYAVVSPYYDSGENAYIVPLSVFGFAQSVIDQAQTSVVTHYIPGSGPGCSGGYCPLNDVVEILSH